MTFHPHITLLLLLRPPAEASTCCATLPRPASGRRASKRGRGGRSARKLQSLFPKSVSRLNRCRTLKGMRTDKHTCRQTDRPIDIRADRWTGRQTDKREELSPTSTRLLPLSSSCTCLTKSPRHSPCFGLPPGTTTGAKTERSSRQTGGRKS